MDSLDPSQVNPESQSDFGNYNCTASNEIGTESREFIMIPAGLFLSIDHKTNKIQSFKVVANHIDIECLDAFCFQGSAFFSQLSANPAFVW